MGMCFGAICRTYGAGMLFLYFPTLTHRVTDIARLWRSGRQINMDCIVKLRRIAILIAQGVSPVVEEKNKRVP